MHIVHLADNIKILEYYL